MFLNYFCAMCQWDFCTLSVNIDRDHALSCAMFHSCYGRVDSRAFYVASGHGLTAASSENVGLGLR
jgi:hypothetical protein